MKKKRCSFCKEKKDFKEFYSFYINNHKKYRSQCKECILKKWEYRNYQLKDKKYCIDCKKQIDPRAAKRCYSCEMKSRKIFKSNANHPKWKGGLPKCIDCGKYISYTAKRCLSCQSKNLTKKLYFCIDCHTKISFKRKRCRSCGRKNYMKINKIHFRGELNPNYRKGGIIPLSDKIRELFEYKEWKNKVFARDNYTCKECKTRGIYLEAHHHKKFNIILKEFLVQYSQFSLIEDKETLIRLAISYQPFWDIDNGQTLCVDCHNKTKIGREKNLITEKTLQVL